VITRREGEWLKRARAAIEARSEDIIRGGLTHEEYKDWCGYIRGLQAAIDFYDDVLKAEGEN